MKAFSFISSARVNWGKSEALMAGGVLGGRLRLPGGLQWKKGGFKYSTFESSWGMRPTQIKIGTMSWNRLGRLEKLRWLLLKMSYRGRTLISNNLVSSSLWHRLACVNPPVSLLSKIQLVLVDFIWDKRGGKAWSIWPAGAQLFASSLFKDC